MFCFLLFFLHICIRAYACTCAYAHIDISVDCCKMLQTMFYRAQTSGLSSLMDQGSHIASNVVLLVAENDIGSTIARP